MSANNTSGCFLKFILLAILFIVLGGIFAIDRAARLIIWFAENFIVDK